MSSMYFNIYMNQFFTTLGQVSGIFISGIVVVPMVNYYGKGKFNYFNPYYWNKRINKSKTRVDGELFVDGDIHCSGDVLAFYKPN